jgi:hypothetical protein
MGRIERRKKVKMKMMSVSLVSTKREVMLVN